MDSRHAVVITGASSGIGRATALTLARCGWHVVLVCRDPARGQNALREIGALPGAPAATLLLCELSCLRALHELAARVHALGLPLKLLINNAATWSSARVLTEEGFERTFAVNYLAPFVLSRQLRLHAPARIVNVSSNIVRQPVGLDLEELQGLRRHGQVRAYRQSKLALTAFTREWARRHASSGVSALSVHPGDVLTNMSAHGFFIDLIRPLLPRVSAEQAAEACAHAALAPELAAMSGAYIERGRAVELGPRVFDAEQGQQLWAASERLVQPFSPELHT